MLFRSSCWWEARVGRPALGLVDDAQDVGLFHDDQVVAFDLDLGARPFAEQDAVADLHIGLDALAALVAAARADGEDLLILTSRDVLAKTGGKKGKK